MGDPFTYPVKIKLAPRGGRFSFKLCILTSALSLQDGGADPVPVKMPQFHGAFRKYDNLNNCKSKNLSPFVAFSEWL